MGNAENRHVPSEADIKASLERTLIGHLEAPEEFNDLSINLSTLSSVVLLSEREGEVESGSCGSMDRYTEDTLMGALSDMGVKRNGSEQGMIAALAENGYIEVGPEGRLFAKEHLTAFMKTLNGSFPTMQGLNLVAYLIQTMDEVISGRKALQFAVEQFGQTLRLQKKAVSPSVGPTDVSGCETKPVQPPQDHKKSFGSLKNALSKRLRNRKTHNVVSGKQQSRESVVVSSTGAMQPLEIQEISPANAETAKVGEPSTDLERAEDRANQEDLITETVPETDSERCGDDEAQSIEQDSSDLSSVLVTEELDAESAADPSSGCDTEPVPGPEPGPAIVSSGENDLADEVPEACTGDNFAETWFDETYEDKYDSGGSDEADKSPNGVSPDLKTTRAPDVQEVEAVERTEDDDRPSDEAVQERIASFYQSLAMTCPLCRSSPIREQKTEKGKSFFTCSDSECVFVSWGKPYLINCPWCKNPFLVQGIGKNGNPVLKCPRATCHYKQVVLDDHPADATGYIAPPLGPSAAPSVGKFRKPVRKAKRVVRRRVVRKKR